MLYCIAYVTMNTRKIITKYIKSRRLLPPVNMIKLWLKAYYVFIYTHIIFYCLYNQEY